MNGTMPSGSLDERRVWADLSQARRERLDRMSLDRHARKQCAQLPLPDWADIVITRRLVAEIAEQDNAVVAQHAHGLTRDLLAYPFVEHQAHRAEQQSQHRRFDRGSRAAALASSKLIPARLIRRPAASRSSIRSTLQRLSGAAPHLANSRSQCPVPHPMSSTFRLSIFEYPLRTSVRRTARSSSWIL